MFVKQSLPALAVLALVAAAGCNQQPSLASRAKVDSLTAVASDRDRLMAEVAEDARTLSAISAELSHVQTKAKLKLSPSESPGQAQRDTVVQRVHLLAVRVNDADARLRESQRKIESMSHLSDSLRATLESTVVNFQHVIDDQKAQLTALGVQVDSLRTLTVALRDTVSNVSLMANTVYYVVGTKDELVKKGIISEEGGSRFLFVLWKSGVTLVPARDLDPNAFTRIDSREVHTIPLPDSSKTYRIVSRNDLTALGTTPDPDGTVHGTEIPIAQPRKFWAGSRFLIIVQG